MTTPAPGQASPPPSNGSVNDSETIDRPATGSVPPARAAEPAREAPGSRIGPFKILQLIGEGGFGSVYLAEQERPVVRRVALKIIKLGMDTAQVVARFEQERQALAIMDHPNIAKVFDAGATETGRPYFAMELCSGEPIGDYCDRHSMTIEARLELFAQVCDAVQHAHTKGVIHRDIKPSNVLVSTQDGKPLAKIIDFGIAKATGHRLTERTLFTQHRQLIGTPEYMSPEQAEGSPDIDTRTDVYSLAVVMYELLTGSTPFAGRDLRSAAYGELERIIREVDPPRPSARLSQSAATLADIASKRRTEARRLGGLVRGELDWIVMRGLEKDRARRYDSPSALAADVRRFLAGEAVVAAPPSAAYRLRKFVRRHRGPVAAVGAVTAALLVGVVAFATQADRARRAEAVARSRLAESEATVKFLDDMLKSVDPGKMGKDVTVRTVLDQAAKDMEGKFAAEPLVAARLHGTMGATYMALGVYDAGKTHMQEGLTICMRELGAEHPDTCRATIMFGLALAKNGEHAEAEALLKKAIADHERIFGRRHEITMAGVEALAALFVLTNRGAEGADLSKEALEWRLANQGSSEREVLSSEALASMNSLATSYTDQGRYEEAERLFERAIEALTRDKNKGIDHAETLDVRANLAWMLYWAAANDNGGGSELKQQRLERSRVMGEEVVKARSRVLGEEHPATLTSLNNLGLVYHELGMWEKAEQIRRRDLEVSERVLGEEHPDTITAIANLGSMLRKQKRFDEAIPILERAVRLSRKSLTSDNYGMAFSMGWLASCYRATGRFAEAEPLQLESRGIALKVFGEGHDISRTMTGELATLYEKWDEAEPGKGYDLKAAEWKARVPTAAAGQ